MNWDAIGAIGEVVGAAAVVISIVYLAVQIRQNTSSTRSTVESEIALTLANSAFNAADGPIPEIIFRGIGDFDVLSDEEKARFVFYVLGWFRVWQLAYDQRMAGNLSNDSWESLELFISSAFTSPGVRRVWDVRGSTFKKSFRDYVESIEPDPNKPNLQGFTEMLKSVEKLR